MKLLYHKIPQWSNTYVYIEPHLFDPASSLPYLYTHLATLFQEARKGIGFDQGWRTGRGAEAERDDLHGRLREHAKSIGQTENLHLADFRCRFMILKGVEADLISPVEAALIRAYSPLWNQTVAGFGLHDVGKERYSQIRTQWDTLHPGRAWTKKVTGATPDIEGIRATIAQALRSLPSP